MSKIVFIATFPNKSNIKDGMIQRIKSIDIEFEDKDRIYLSIGRKVNFIPSRHKISDSLVVLNLNLYLHFWIIAYYLFVNNNFYIHSLFNYNLVRNLTSFKRKNVCIDVHGSVPEEFEFYGDITKSKKMNRIERRYFSIATTIVCVSEQMKKYYSSKYPFILDKNIIVKPIYSTNVLRSVSEQEKENIYSDLHIQRDKVILLYSGNIQKWQNFDLMIETIASIMKPDYHFIILTGEPESAKAIVASHNLPFSQITIKSVLPSELAAYYAIANYGFILRDEHILNKVAAPTKLIEYLYYGLIPIVKYTEIGDASLLNYDYLVYDNIQDLSHIKSFRNTEIAVKILNQSIRNKLINIYNV